MGSSRRAHRRALRPAAAGTGDCAAPRRLAQRRLPAGSRALPALLTQAAHPLAPEVRLVDTRDLAWLIGSLLIVIAPHTLRAPWWLTVLTLCLFGWRLYCTLNRAPLPSRWLVIGDRKSTRLNSSHRCISYAVFCLKKKKEQNEHLPLKCSKSSNTHYESEI